MVDWDEKVNNGNGAPNDIGWIPMFVKLIELDEGQRAVALRVVPLCPIAIKLCSRVGLLLYCVVRPSGHQANVLLLIHRLGYFEMGKRGRS